MIENIRALDLDGVVPDGLEVGFPVPRGPRVQRELKRKGRGGQGLERGLVVLAIQKLPLE
jgi:hypothetical protein